MLLCAGSLITWQNDTRHQPGWFGNSYHDSDYLLVRINEPLIEKAKSYKADGLVEYIIHNDSMVKCHGKILLYFAKDSNMQLLQYGDLVVINKPLQRIKNSGNPGGFNYERYAGFQQIFHNVFLKENDWIKTGTNHANAMKQFVFTARDHVLAILRKNINSNKDELGIAQALLIGYTNDLDKDLVQAYSNTGVVHIIAISGMHLGLIYILLVWIFGKIPLINRSKILQVLLILACLWLFALVTGAAASVTRAAVMFTCITVGTTFKRKSTIYNSLAASAFVMLCYNPYFLWDVGFQLSFLAVISIISFQKSVYNWLYIKNKMLDKIWKLAAISIAAQILTFPICIYYFHQFPNLFMFTNIIAVPLSSIILYTEIALVSISAIVPMLGIYGGKLVGWLVGCMNGVIIWFNHFAFSVWDKIPATPLSTCLLYAVVIATAAWLLKRNKNWLKFSLMSLLAFLMLHATNKWSVKNQQKVVVYNVPQHRAIDFINGNEYIFAGDSVLLEDGMLQNFHLKPGRIALQITKTPATISQLFQQQPYYQFHNNRILLVDQALHLQPVADKVNVDLIILSHGAKTTIAQLADIFTCKCYVFDASNSLWKIGKWQKECEELHLRSYSVPEMGAYIQDVR